MRKRDSDPITSEIAAGPVLPGESGSGTATGGITAYLEAWRVGDPGAFDDLVPIIYGELRQLARAKLRAERASHTLQPTALVHEVYLRLKEAQRVRWQSRTHFFGSVARLMRQILVDYARRRQAMKRGGGATLLVLDEASGGQPEPQVEILDLERALSKLAVMDPRQARIVELRFFTGLTISEVADLLAVGTATVERDWRIAKAWLLRELRRG